MRAIRVTAGIAAVLIYCLIVLGAVVRATNSGLSCPDWPTCYGHWVPLPSDIAALPDIGYTYGQVMLEWVHRLVAGVLLGPLVLLLAGLTFWRRRAAPGLALMGGGLLLLLLIQGALGGVTVLDRNSPWSVAVHLGNALLVLSLTLRIYAAAADWRAPASARGLGLIAATAWGLALLAMMSAAMTAKSGASLACATWPSCNGTFLPDLGDEGVRFHYAHRVLAAGTTLSVLLLLVRAWLRTSTMPAVRGPAAFAAVLILAQVSLGAAVILLEVPVDVAVIHQAVGVLTFATVTLLMWRCLPPGGRAGMALGDRSDGLALRGA